MIHPSYTKFFLHTTHRIIRSDSRGRVLFCGLILSLLFNTFSTASYSGEIIKTVSLNFNSETVPEDFRSRLRDRRINAMISWMKQNSPDLIFIEEGWNHRGSPSIVKSLAEAMGYTYHYRLTMGVNGLLMDSNGILLRPGFEIEDAATFKLAHASPTLGDGKTWIVSLGSTSWGVGAKIKTPGGNTLYAYATHLIGKTEAKRRDQVKSLHDAIEHQIFAQGEDPAQAKILIAGDLNETPDSSTLNALRSLGYQDSFKEAHPEARDISQVCTFCGNPFNDSYNPMTLAPNQVPAQSAIEGDLRIDYILSKGPEIRSRASTIVFTEPLNGVWMSDHYGLETTFELGAPSGSIVSNPITDRTRTLPRAQVIEITDRDLDCDAEGCHHLRSNIEVNSATGVTFLNHTRKALKITLKGNGSIWPGKFALPRSGRVAAFFFDPGPQNASFKARHLFSQKLLQGVLNVDSSEESHFRESVTEGQ